jgi:hypothetical protein
VWSPSCTGLANLAGITPGQKIELERGFTMALGVTPPFGGLSLGAVKIIFGALSNPNDGPDSGGGDLAGCGVGSLYLSQADGSLWSKTANDKNAPYGVWASHA